MYRHFIGYLNITGHGMTHLSLADLRNHSKDHSRNAMPNRLKTIPLKLYPIGQKLFTSQAGGFADHFHPFMSHCIFMCIVGSENMLLSKRSGAKF